MRHPSYNYLTSWIERSEKYKLAVQLLFGESVSVRVEALAQITERWPHETVATLSLLLFGEGYNKRFPGDSLQHQIFCDDDGRSERGHQYPDRVIPLFEGAQRLFVHFESRDKSAVEKAAFAGAMNEVLMQIANILKSVLEV